HFKLRNTRDQPGERNLSERVKSYQGFGMMWKNSNASTDDAVQQQAHQERWLVVCDTMLFVETGYPQQDGGVVQGKRPSCRVQKDMGSSARSPYRTIGAGSLLPSGHGSPQR